MFGNNHFRKPTWFDDAPKWFQSFYSNDFYHLIGDVKFNRRMNMLLLGAIVAGAIAIICSTI